MQQVYQRVNRTTSRKGTTLFEIIIVLGLVAILGAATAVYNKGIQRQIVITREHATALSLFIRARSAGLTAPQGGVGELVCGYGVHIDAASRTFTYFKDLGDYAAQSCASATRAYESGETIDQRTLSNAVTVTSDDVDDLVYVPPFGRVYMDGAEAQDTASVIITGVETGSSKGIRANAYGQISEFLPTP